MDTLHTRSHVAFLFFSPHDMHARRAIRFADVLARSAKVAQKAICFTDRNFFLFFNDFSETNYLKIRWTDFRNLYLE